MVGNRRGNGILEAYFRRYFSECVEILVNF